jgi:hypothetical protein
MYCICNVQGDFGRGGCSLTYRSYNSCKGDVRSMMQCNGKEEKMGVDLLAVYVLSWFKCRQIR